MTDRDCSCPHVVNGDMACRIGTRPDCSAHGDPLVEQAGRTIYEADPATRTYWPDPNLPPCEEVVAWEDVPTKLSELTRNDYLHPAEVLVDAGWRPPPSDDVTEQAAVIVASPGRVGPKARQITQALADAGYLREPPPSEQTYDRERERLAHAIHKAVQSSRVKGTVPFLVGDAERAVTAVITEGWTPPAGYGEANHG